MRETTLGQTSDAVLQLVDRYTMRVANQAPRIAELGEWPDYIDVQESLTGRVPTAQTPSSGFDAGIACTLGLIPSEKQKLSASLHAAYTPAAIEQVRRETEDLAADSETCWWLAACSVCTEGKLTPQQFYEQILSFEKLREEPERRLEAARAELQAMGRRYEVKDGIAFGTVDGAMQGAYIGGHDLAALYDPEDSLYFIGTFRETLGLESFLWSDEVDEQGRPRSGPIHGSRQYVKAADEAEYARVLDALRSNGLLS